MAELIIIAIAIINAAQTIARAILCFSIISFQRFSGVIFSMIQNANNRIRIPITEYNTEATIYL